MRSRAVMVSGAVSAVLGLAGGPGCSYVFVEGPPPASANPVARGRPKAARPAADSRPGGAEALAATARWPEDDAIARAYGGKVVRSCWLKGAAEGDGRGACVLRGDFDAGRPQWAQLSD